jgi:hypothetical protein
MERCTFLSYPSILIFFVFGFQIFYYEKNLIKIKGRRTSKVMPHKLNTMKSKQWINKSDNEKLAKE